MMPPNPPIVIKHALAKARFHSPRMLFAWYAMTVAILEFVAPAMRKTPKYCEPVDDVQARRHRPTMDAKELTMMIGPLRWNLSPTQA